MHEGAACADYLITQCGVPAGSILKECSSYDTIGNAYFAATIHAVPAGWNGGRLAIVTSDFHMPRSRAIFETIFSLSDATHSSRCDAVMSVLRFVFEAVVRGAAPVHY